MIQLEINGKRVEVDDSFKELSPEDQQATVEEIAASLSAPQDEALPEGRAPTPLEAMTTLLPGGMIQTDSGRTGLSHMVDTATLGLAPHAIGLGQAAGTAIRDMFTGKDSGSFGENYNEGKSAVRGELREGADDSPFNAMLGQIAGAFGPGIVGGTAATNLATKAAPYAASIPGWLMQAAGQSAAGATEAIVNALAREQGDVGRAATIGGVLGAGGDMLMRGASGIKRTFWPSPDDIKYQVANKLTGKLATIAGSDFDPATLQREVADMGPDAMVADVDSILREEIAGAIDNGATEETIGAIRQAASRRSPDVSAEDTILAAFQGPTRTQMNISTKDALKSLTDEYRTVVADMNTKMRAKPSALVNTINNTFGRNPVGVVSDMKNKVLKLVDQATLGDPNASLSASDLINIKQDIDRTLESFDNTFLADTTVKGTRKQLSQIKSKINEFLSAQSPQYADLMGRYSDEFEMNSAAKLGEAVFANPNRQLAEEAADIYNGLRSPMAKAAFESGAAYSLSKSAQNMGSMRALQRAAGTRGGTAVRDTMEAVFGEKKATALIDQANRLSSIELTNKAVERSTHSTVREGTKPNASGGDTSILRSAADLATLIFSGARGEFTSGPFAGSAKRTGALVTENTARRMNDEMARVLGSSGSDAQANLEMLKQYMERRTLGIPMNAGAFTGITLPPEW